MSTDIESPRTTTRQVAEKVMDMTFLLTVYVRLSPWRRLQARRALGWGDQT